MAQQSIAIRVTTEELEPMHDHILAEPVTEERSLAGLIIPVNSVNGSGGNGDPEGVHAFRVVKVGQGRVSQYNGEMLPNIDIVPGDFIIAPGELMLPITADERQHILVKAAHVVCRIRPSANPHSNGATPHADTKNPSASN